MKTVQNVTDFTYLHSIIQEGATHALIDVDNTIAKANITELYLWMKRKEMKSKVLWYLWLVYFAVFWGPIYLLLDFIDRDLFQKAFYRRYHHFSLKEIEANSKELFEQKYKKKFIRYTHDLIFYLKENNVEVTLLSTNINCIVREYADYFKVPCICLEVEEMNQGIRVNLEQLKNFKFRAATHFATKSTIAVADSKHDLPVLNYVNYPLIVSDKKKRWMVNLRKEVILISEASM